jgi:sec-independent protein translocase protein TatB
MLPDIGAAELLLIAVVALIVVGPKDLPLLMRKVGQFLAKLRGMAAEFRASFDEMARQSELEELRREVEAMRSGRMMTDPLASAEAPVRSAISDIEQSLAETGAQFHPPMSHQITGPDTVAEPDPPPPEPKPAEAVAAPKPASAKPPAKAASAKAKPKTAAKRSAPAAAGARKARTKKTSDA